MADAQHSIITPECREGRGDEGAWEEAVARAKAVYDEIVAGWKDAPYQPTLHLHLSIERPYIPAMPAAAPPKAGNTVTERSGPDNQSVEEL